MIKNGGNFCYKQDFAAGTLSKILGQAWKYRSTYTTTVSLK